MELSQGTNASRAKSAVGVALLHALLGYAFLTGLGFALPVPRGEELKLLDLPPEPPPPPKPKSIPARVRVDAPEGAASPPNLKSTPTEIVAPSPEIKLPLPPPVIAAPLAGIGADASQGAAELPGPGTGSGGIGEGTGSGGEGNGTGGGGGLAARARWIRGSIDPSDYPRAAAEAGLSGTVHLRFTVGANGRVTACSVTKSSGSADLDSTTCRLILKRFRYRPALDRRGKPVPDVVSGEHVWSIRQLEAPAEPEEDRAAN